MYEPCTLAAAELQSLHVLLYYIRILTTCTLSARIYVMRDDVIIKETSYQNQSSCVAFILRLLALEFSCRWIFPFCMICCYMAVCDSEIRNLECSHDFDPAVCSKSKQMASCHQTPMCIPFILCLEMNSC